MKNSLKLLLLLSCSIYIFCSKPDQDKPNIINLKENWKFNKGDSPVWADPNYNDSSWITIKPDRLWEEQGIDGYDGYAWYRVKFMLPSSLKEKSYFKDSLQIILGKIDDTEQTFFNGSIIGQNGKLIPANAKQPEKFEGNRNAYRIDRRYVLSVDDKRILWDKENTLAIRVHDHGGGGGLYASKQSVSMMDLKDYIKINTSLSSFGLNEKDEFTKSIVIENMSNEHDFTGKLKIKIGRPGSKRIVFQSDYPVTLDKKGESKEISFAFQAPRTDPYVAEYKFVESESKIAVFASQEVPYILTPAPPAEPRINGPKVFGVRPGNLFFYTIPATGKRPMSFDVKQLPAGLKVDKKTGQIAGVLEQSGEYIVNLMAKNELGEAEREFKIIVGDRIALTPPLGWNSWNCWGLSVDDQKVKQAADFMVSSGLVNHGWTYINIDDGWESPVRLPNGDIATNEKFPDMKKLADYVHSKGLKIGIYSSPGPLTCGGYLGSYLHEYQDAQKYGEWGIDYLKYDWCSYIGIAKDNSRGELMRPYFIMRDQLNKVKRDIVYSLCQYGMGEVWKWGDVVGGNLWRTTGDIVDTWGSMSGIGFNQIENTKYAGPGHWNDPDMLVVGWVGWGPNIHPSRLSASEQYTHISLWALLSSPLLIGCDLSKLDDFTLNLLTNDEVLAVNQDPLGRQAAPVFKNDDIQIWAKDLENGELAVGLFNLSDRAQYISIKWKFLAIEGKYQVRDLWRQKDIGTFGSSYGATVLSHGVVLVKLTKKK